jgi:TonB family protein
MFWNGLLAMSFLLLFDQFPQTVHLSTGPPPRPPSKTVETGLVILSTSIDSTGTPTAPEVAQGSPPFTGPALDAVRRWGFLTNNAKTPVPVTITMLFRARTVLPDRPFAFDMPSAAFSMDGPPEPKIIIDSGYPIESIAEGCVILQLQIDSTGKVQKTDVIQNIPSLTASAVRAVSQWQFLPARQDGKAVPGTVVAVISFLRPVLTY